MQKRTKSAPAHMSARLIALATAFLIGAAVGSYFAAGMSGAAGEYLEAYLGQKGFSGAWQAPVCELALVLAVFLSAFFRAGLPVPFAALGAKGFLLSMLVTSLVKAYGARGFAAALPALLLSGFVPLLCLVLVALQAVGILRERRGAGRGGRVYIDKSFYLATAICAAAAAICAALNIYLTQALGRVVLHLTGG